VIVDTFDGARLSEQISASESIRTPEGWEFKNGTYRKFAVDGVSIEKTEVFSDRLFAFKEKADDLVTQEPEPEEMNFNTLRRHIDKLSALGVPVRGLEVELMMKLSLPFTCFVVTFLGVPLAMSGKGSRAMGIGAGGALTLVYLGFIQFGKALAQRLITPWVGAWLGNIVFLSIALFLWWRMRRTS
jgi:lipopolysaccharide export system permease protein